MHIYYKIGGDMKNQDIIIDRAWIRYQIRESIERHMDEGIISSALGLIDKVPILGKFGKKMIVNKIADVYGLNNTDGFINVFIFALLETLSLEQMGKIYEGSIERDEILEILVEALSVALTREAIEEILIYLLQNYDIEDIVNNVMSYDPTSGKEDKLYTVDSFLPGGKKTHKVSANQAREIMNSMVGTIGMTVIEKFVADAAKKYILPKVADAISEMSFDELEGVAKTVTGGETSASASGASSSSVSMPGVK